MLGVRHADFAGFWVARLLFGMHGRTTVVSLTPWHCPWHCLTARCFLSPKTFSVHPRASLSRPGTLSLRPRNQDIAVLLNAFDFRRSPGYGSGTTSLGSSSSGHSHASHFSAPRHRSGARAQGTVVFSTPRHRGGAREVRVPGAVMRPFSRAKSEARAATCLWGATYLSRERYTSLRHNLGGGHISGVRISGEPHISREPHIGGGGAYLGESHISTDL